MVFCSVDPATDEVVAEYPTLDSAEAQALLGRLTDGFSSWRRQPFERRAACLRNLADLLVKRAEKGARLMAREMGKPLGEGIAEMQKCAKVCTYYAEHGARFLEPQTTATDASSSRIEFAPLGPILAIMPWNFPFWQVFRFAAPALMAGNTVMLKHAPNVIGCANMIEDLIGDSGFPEDVSGLLVAELDVVAEMIAHPQIRAVTLTGSTRAGRSVAELAGRHLKKVVLELGGSDPYIVLDDAELDLAAKRCVTSRLINSGQSCIAAKRFIVLESVERAFSEAVLAEMKTKTFGNPLEGTGDIGPMARKDLRDTLHAQVLASIAAGAKLLLGGTLPEGPGCFYPPTLLTVVPPDSPAFREEMFGPVASIITARDEEHAVALANRSDYGLGAAIFTGDRQRGERLARDLEAGACFINDFVRSDPRLPFGGIKDSGYGRELSIFGIREFVNIKTVWID